MILYCWKALLSAFYQYHRPKGERLRNGTWKWKIAHKASDSWTERVRRSEFPTINRVVLEVGIS
jgi:hypothetical protein